MASGSYTNNTWAGANNTTVTLGSHTSDALTTYSLRFATAAADTVNLSSSSSASPNVITTGGILISSAVAGNASAIGGGFLTSGNSQDLIVNQLDTSGALRPISSAIVNNGGTPIGLTLSGTTIENNGALGEP